MSKVFFTLVGTEYRYGSDFLEPGMKVRLEKEPDNEVDSEAIQVILEGLGKIGYVAASYRTRIGESWSCGRLFDKITEGTEGTVVYKTSRGILCSVEVAAEEEEL